MKIAILIIVMFTCFISTMNVLSFLYQGFMIYRKTQQVKQSFKSGELDVFQYKTAWKKIPSLKVGYKICIFFILTVLSWGYLFDYFLT